MLQNERILVSASSLTVYASYAPKILIDRAAILQFNRSCSECAGNFEGRVRGSRRNEGKEFLY